MREPVAAAEGLTPEDMRELLPRAERGVELERSASAQAVEDGNQELKSDHDPGHQHKQPESPTAGPSGPF